MMPIRKYPEELCGKLGLYGVPEIMVKAQFIRFLSDIRNEMVEKFGKDVEKYFDDLLEG